MQNVNEFLVVYSTAASTRDTLRHFSLSLLRSRITRRKEDSGSNTEICVLMHRM